MTKKISNDNSSSSSNRQKKETEQFTVVAVVRSFKSLWLTGQKRANSGIVSFV